MSSTSDWPASLPGPSARTFTFPYPVSPQAVGGIHPVQPHRAIHRYEVPVFDRPGRKVAAEYEPDPDELRTRCQQQGGKESAVDWVSELFVDEVTVDPLLRPLTMPEVHTMSLRLPGFGRRKGMMVSSRESTRGSSVVSVQMKRGCTGRTRKTLCHI